MHPPQITRLDLSLFTTGAPYCKFLTPLMKSLSDVNLISRKRIDSFLSTLVGRNYEISFFVENVIEIEQRVALFHERYFIERKREFGSNSIKTG